MNYLWSVDDRGDIPASRGLAATIKLPATVARDKFKLVYDWWWPPSPALGDVRNIGSDVGAIVTHLPAWVARVKDWCEVYIPAGFEGWICSDLEGFYVQQLNNDPALLASAMHAHPEFTWAELVCLIHKAFIAEARKTWPKAKYTVFGGIGTAPWLDYQESLHCGARDGSQLVKIMDGACPETYASDKSYNDECRIFQDIYDQNKAAGADPAKGVAITNARPNGANGLPAMTAVSFEGTYAALYTAWKNGYTTVAIWDAIESIEARDLVQSWVNDVFIPAAAKLERVIASIRPAPVVSTAAVKPNPGVVALRQPPTAS